MIRFLKIMALICAINAGPLSSAALAIVNIETLRGSTAPGVSGQTEFGASYSAGNTDELRFRLSAGLRVHFGRGQLLALTSGQLNEAGDSRFERKAFAHLRYHHLPDQTLSAEVFSQIQYDENLRIDRRTLVGAGARWRAFSDTLTRAFAGIGAMYEEERLRADVTDTADTQRVRLTSYVSLNGVWGVTKISSVTYLQPRVTDFGDMRTINQSGLMVAINSNVSLSLNFDLAFDSRPAPGVEKLDTETSMGVKLVW